MGVAGEPKFHVLAVDDSLVDRKLIERLLKTSSYQVTTVDSGSKALEFLGLQEDDEQKNLLSESSGTPNTQQQQQLQQKVSAISSSKKDVEVNLIITDYCMPGMTGYELLKKIKESSSSRNIPVVIMSSEYDNLRISRCLDEGAKEFFLKPVQLSDVNKLRPHMMEAKNVNQNPDMQLQSESYQQQKPEAQKVGSTQPPEGKQLPQMLQSMPSIQQSNNKRKNIDGAISPDRARPRYNGLTVV